MEITVRTYDEVSNERVRIEVAPGQRAEIQIVDDRVSTHDPAQAAEELRRQVQELTAKLAQATKGHVCTDSCKPGAHVAFTGRKRLQEAEARIEELEAKARERESRIQELSGRVLKAEAQVREYDRDRKTERDRADGNKGWAERAEQRLQEAEAKLATQTQRADRNKAWAERERDRAVGNKGQAERAEQRLADQAEEHRQSLAARDAILSTSVRKINHARELLSADEVDQARRMNMTRTGVVMAGAIGAALRVLDQA